MVRLLVSKNEAGLKLWPTGRKNLFVLFAPDEEVLNINTEGEK